MLQSPTNVEKEAMSDIPWHLKEICPARVADFLIDVSMMISAQLSHDDYERLAW